VLPTETDRSTIKKGGGCVALFLFFWLCLVYVHQNGFNSPTPVSRLDLLHALANEGRVRLDTYAGNTSDVSLWKGSYYSDKAPGTVVLAAPAFFAARWLLAFVGIQLDSSRGWLVSSWIACAGSLALAASAGGVACYAWLCRYVTHRIALVTALAIFLGGMPLPYSTMLFSHALVAGFLSIAIWAIDAAPGGRSLGRDILGGCCAGWALACEYTAGLIVGVLIAWIFSLSKRRAIFFCAAMIVPLLSIPLYSWACFGTPLILPYSLQASFPEMRQGLYAIKWPDAANAVRLLFLPCRGLFFWSPFLLLWLWGAKKVFRLSGVLFLVTCLAPAIQIVVISGRVWDWQAGPTVGPRYLTPILPFVALPCALAMMQKPVLGRVLAVCSIALMVLATITNATPHGGIMNPLMDVHLPALAQGKFCHNLGLAAGLSPWPSIILYVGLISIGGVLLYSRAPSCPEAQPSKASISDSGPDGVS
jgi:hypothetical protein